MLKWWINFKDFTFVANTYRDQKGTDIQMYGEGEKWTET